MSFESNLSIYYRKLFRQDFEVTNSRPSVSWWEFFSYYALLFHSSRFLKPSIHFKNVSYIQLTFLKKNIYIVELFKNVTRNPTGKADDYAICLVVIAQNSRAYELWTNKVSDFTRGLKMQSLFLQR
jgi:hypothetical protein